MTLLLDLPEAARRWCDARRAEGRSIAFVPTMGALHAGHLALVERARAECDLAVVSIFVNPLQFDDRRDLERYPRDLEGDLAKLAGAGADMAFTGTLAQFFPGGLDVAGRRARELCADPESGALGLEGERRPGHFEGVATIVARLFDVVGADVACFGQKDFQQTLVVRELARRRGGPRIAVCPTVRERSGLALSSRNELLSGLERARAACLWRALCAAAEAWRSGARRAAELSRALHLVLEAEAVEVEYASVRDPERWAAGEPEGELERAVALVAARIDGVRLIDNHLLHSGAAAAASGAR